MNYHPGIVIKKYRKAQKWTQAHLASCWPRTDGGTGVYISYIQEIEYGQKDLVDQQTLRKVAALLHIPLEEFGLSTYNPYDPFASAPIGSKRLDNETLHFLEYCIKRFEDAYHHQPLPVAAADAEKLHAYFEHLRAEYPPSAAQESNFLRLYAQVRNLDGVILLGLGRYDEALSTFENMRQIAHESGDVAMTAHSFLTVGIELERAGKKREAVKYLEASYDTSLSGSKDLIAYTSAYLARCYAGAGDASHFERAINVALNVATPQYGTGTDFVYHQRSGLDAEKSYGYLELGQPEKVLAMRPEFEAAISRDNNARLHAWASLDFARAYLQLRDIEASAIEAREFLTRAQNMQTPHIINRAKQFIAKLYNQYPGVSMVRELYQEAGA